MNISAPSSAETLNAAFEFARQGQIESAESLCNQVLLLHAEHPDALRLRAVIEVQSGRTAAGAATARRAIAQDPTRAALHVLLGEALLTLKQPHAALDSFDRALMLAPALPSAHYGRGNALLDVERPRDALASYDRVLEAQPADAEALFNRGNALLRLRDYPAAVASFDRALALQPAYAKALSNRGTALLLQEHIEPALASFEAAAAVDPDFAEAHYNRGCALWLLDRFPPALAALDRALQLQPDYADALVSRGHVLRDLNSPEEALASFDRALRLRPGQVETLSGRGDCLLDLGRAAEALAAQDVALEVDPRFSGALNSRGNCLRALKRFADAVATFDRCLELDPNNATVHYNRATALLQWDGHGEEALLGFERALALDPRFMFLPGELHYNQQHRADWSVRNPAATPQRLIESVLADTPATAPFSFLSVSDSAAAQLACARVFLAHRCAPGVADPASDAARRPRPDDARIRIAYVSSDLREHALSYLMAGVFERHDADRFDVTAISLRPAEATDLGKRIQRAFARFIDVSTLTDREVRSVLRDLHIDIAVNLNGFTEGFRPQIFALRAAPIQVNYLGYPGTLGASYMDYIVADRFVIPPHSARFYSEQVVYLPDCFQANDDRRSACREGVTRAAAGLPEGAFVFCCLNNSHKLNPAMFDVWMRLLERTPHSVLWLLAHEPACAGNLRAAAAARGVDPARLIFASRMPYADYLGRLALADLYLDTLPFNAGTTASDVLWAGVPLLTCAGDAFAARMGGSLLHAIGVPDLVTHSLAEYEARALALARQPAALAALRARLAENRRRLPLFDTGRFTRHLEAAYAEMWRRHARGDAPGAFAVTALDVSH